MYRLLESFRALNAFLKWQLCIGFVISLAWSLCVPILHKLQGVYWSTAFISVYLALDRVSGMLVPLFRGERASSLRVLFQLGMALDLLYVFGLLLYFYDVQVFLLVEIGLGMCFGVLNPLWKICYDMHVVTHYKAEVYEDFLYLESFRSSFGGVVGCVLAAIVSYVMETDSAIICFMIAMIVTLCLQQLNWVMFYRELD